MGYNVSEKFCQYPAPIIFIFSLQNRKPVAWSRLFSGVDLYPYTSTPNDVFYGAGTQRWQPITAVTCSVILSLHQLLLVYSDTRYKERFLFLPVFFYN